MKNALLKLLLAFLPDLLKKVTPGIREALKERLAAWEKEALATPNPYDDMLVDFFQAVLGLDEDE